MRSLRRAPFPLAMILAIVSLTACAGDTDDTGEVGETGDAVAATDAERAVADEGLVEPAPSPEPTGGGPRPTVLAPGMSWQWQLQDDIDTSHDVDVYDVDLFDTPSATIDRLHADDRIVICYFSTAYEDWRDDASDWPDDALGSPLDDWDGERWVDIRDDGVRAVLIARLDLASARGCDGVEPDNVTAYRNESGFDLTPDDQLEFNRLLADAAHERGLVIGLKNALEQIPDLVDRFDFAVNEQCVEYDECDVYEPFVAAGKPVFGAEYADDVDAAADDLDRVCAVANEVGISMLVLPVDLDDSFRISC